ncbi:UPF0149 family protein [Alteromonas sp. C1M14]|uniref:UPF0149 family protein n=1 Tax=Alteromonas sp. C1M14 TaxID=2841567 RepID=UPI001C09831A|nr:UPF0149 family protein [Alteromonas sp. C1M14]
MTTLDDLYLEPTLQVLLPEKAYTQGFTFAVATSPEIPMPETWMPWLMTKSGDLPSTSLLDTLAEGLMDGLRTHLNAMRLNAALLPQRYLTLSAGMPNPTLSLWLTGLLAAHAKLEPCWQRAWTLAKQSSADDLAQDKEDPSKRLTRCLKLFTTLADAQMALSMRNQEQRLLLKENMSKLVAQIPAILEDYVELAGELAGVLPNQFENFTQPSQ